MAETTYFDPALFLIRPEYGGMDERAFKEFARLQRMARPDCSERASASTKCQQKERR